MFKEKLYRYGCWFVVCFALCMGWIFPGASQAKSFKVLVVMSYDETFPWVTETKEGIDSVLGSSCELKYFYMDTKRNPEGGEEKGKEAYKIYQEFQPDGVIAGDDDAQPFFVVPYLKEKVKTPVIFCGVNAAPEKYGYPASNVSGILERYHVAESIAFVQQVDPSLKTFGYIMKESSTGRAALEQIQSEAASYPAKFIDFRLPNTLQETVAMTEELKKSCDILFTPTMQGITDDKGNPLSDKEVLPLIAKTFGKPVIGGSGYNIKYGMLCGVIKTGQEQGRTASKMLLKAMEGAKVSDMPITRNQNGKRIINVTMMKKLGIKPNPVVLEGAELLKGE